MTTGTLLSTLSDEIASVVAHMGESVVRVQGGRHRPATGTVVERELVLVADHVIEREEDLRVGAPDGQVVAARFAGRDPSHDLALLRVPGLDVAPIAVAAVPPRVGQIVMAVGRSWGGGLSASLGLIAATGASIRTAHGPNVQEVIRPDMNLRPGLPGSPLVDSRGGVVGIVTTGLVRGTPLAIPSAIAWRVGRELAAHGRIRRGHLGISTQPIRIPANQRAGRAQEAGVLIVGIGPATPAEKAGLLVGDIVVGFERQAIGDPDELLVKLTADLIDRAATVEVIRGTAIRTLEVIVGEYGA
jgi:S1-C subfamily serine protease